MPSLEPPWRERVEAGRQTLSVVIPTYNRRARLQRVLEALAVELREGSDRGDVEVIVISDGSTDGTDDYLRSPALPLPIVAITQRNQGPAEARNAGIRAATGEIVLFLDDDVLPAPGLVATHRRRHQELGPDAVVIGPMLTPEEGCPQPWIDWEQSKLYEQYDAMTSGQWAATARQFYTGNASVRRAHLERAGGFDPSFTRAEDVELAYRLADLGLQFVFEPDARGYHHAERSYASWLDNARAYGRNDAVLGRQPHLQWLLPVVRREFGQQHVLLRWMVVACLGRRPLSTPATVVVGALGRRLAPLSRTAGHAALSAVYNLAYYQGIAEVLGGRSRFFELPVAEPVEELDGEAAADDLSEPSAARRPIGSVVIPAHNEAAVIERCLDAFGKEALDGEFEIVVVANGCLDDTAERARRAAPSATVLELDVASKAAALNAGDAAASAFPRAYLDADVVIDADALRATMGVLDRGAVPCAAPRMVVELSGRPWYVRSFYRAFLELPYLKDNMVGNGFYALSEDGRQRFESFPDITADDLFVRNLFAPSERLSIRSGTFTMHAPRRLGGLLAIRRRTYRGNQEYQASAHRVPTDATRSAAAYLDLVRRRPFDLVVYLTINVLARLRSVGARGGQWERDDSGRTG